MARHRRIFISSLILALVIGVLPQQTAWATEGGVQSFGEIAAGEVLVGYLPDRVSRAQLADVGQVDGDVAPASDMAVTLLRVPVGQEQAALARLRKLPGVVYAEPNGLVRGAFTPNDPFYNDPNKVYAPQQVRANLAWDMVRGAPCTVIAVIDTGVDFQHPDLAGTFWINPGEIPGNGVDDDGNGFVDDVQGWDFVNNDNNPTDDHGHGTHVTGILAAHLNNGVGIAGIAAGVRVLPLKVLNFSNVGTWANVAAAVNYAANKGVRAINLSLGGPVMSVTLRNAVRYAQERGVLVVAAAGNDASSDPFYPAAFDDVVGVGATIPGGERWSLSNYGSYVDVMAPGASVYSTYWQPGTGSQYWFMSGTSMAAPIVTGVAALLWSINPSFTASQISEFLTQTARSRSTLGPASYCSTGEVDAFAAVLQAESTLPPSGIVMGRLWVDINGDGVRQPTESQGLGRVSVYLSPSGGSGASVMSVTTDSAGAYYFTQVRPGTYQVRAVVPAGYQATTPLEATIVVGQNVVEADFGFILPTGVKLQAIQIIPQGRHLRLVWQVAVEGMLPGSEPDATWQVYRAEKPDGERRLISPSGVLGQDDGRGSIVYCFEDAAMPGQRVYWYWLYAVGSAEWFGPFEAVLSSGDSARLWLPLLSR